MADADNKREIPHTWREYLKGEAETLKVFRWILRELVSDTNRRWTKRWLSILLVATIFEAVEPRLLSAVFDGLATKRYHLAFLGLLGFVGAMTAEKLLGLYLSRAREWLLGVNWGILDSKITKLFFEKSMGQHIQEGATLSVANIDKGRWRLLDMQGLLLFEGIPTILTLVVSYLLLWYLSPVAGLIMSCVLAVCAIWMLHLNHKVVEICTPIDGDLRKLNRHRVERWDKYERVSTCGKEREELSKMDSWFDKTIAEDRNFWLWFIGQIFRRELVSILGLSAIMVYGCLLVYRGTWSIGLLYPLFSWSMRVVERIWHIGRIEHVLNWNMPSVKSMIEALSIPPDALDSSDAAEVTDRGPIGVRFENVTHAYPPEKKNGDAEPQRTGLAVLKKVNFEIRPGEKVALLGPSGAGKTTIMRLLLRYMDPQEGKIHVNGWDLKNVKRSSWMHVLGYIPQQPQIFDGTIRYNLTYGLGPEEVVGVTDDDLWRLMRLLKIDFGERLHDGLETLVGRNGVKLSGGQAQRLMIGAAAIKKPIFMVIDEATSSLDSSTEKAVQEGLGEILRGSVSALVVAHRLSTVRHLCDRFIVLRDSESVPDGESQIEATASSFEELYAISPTFRQLADDQDVRISAS